MNPLHMAIKTAFSKQFCSELEYHLSSAFQNCSDSEFNRLWCDGIEVPDIDQQSSKQPNKVFTMAWFGSTGQDRYKMTIKLGKRAIENCRKGLDLTNCLPGDESLDWVYLDMENKEMELRLK